MGLSCVVMALAGCGGGGSSSSAPPVTSRSIQWVTNWGAIFPIDPLKRLGSFNVELFLRGANTDGTDFVTNYNYNYPGSLSPSGVQTLSSSGSVKVGTFPMDVYIKNTDIGGEGGGGGALEAFAHAVVRITPTVPVDSHGHQAPDFQIDMGASAVDSITVPAGQTIKVGASAPLIFTAHPRGATSHILVLAYGSEKVQFTSGADHLSYDFLMTGLTPGTATFTVTASGITSAPATVTVVP